MVETEEQLSSKVTMDVYIRMNEDPEQDYCFNVPINEPVSWLHKVFETLPMVLSPNYFFNSQPIGFGVSTQPGFLTSEGGLLFKENAHKEEWTKKVDQSAKIGDVCYEGQLIIPVWQYDYSRQVKVLTLLGGWLYLDLPEYINPTPGYAPTQLIYAAAEYLIPALTDDAPSGFDGLWWQWGFFTMHLLKCALIYLILWAGGVNPVSFNPIKNRMALKKDMTKEKLLEIGWTSSRRACPSEWVEENRKAKIDQHGGVVNAYHAGVLDGIGSSGVHLEKGEGWDTNAKEVGKDDGKFRISKEYLVESYKDLAMKLQDAELEDGQKVAIIKQFRRSGPETGTDDLKKRYADRKSLEKKEEETKTK